jgi:hypothetical protein
MLSSTVFLGAVFVELLALKSKMDGYIIALISTTANRGSTGFIVWIVIFVLRRSPIDRRLILCVAPLWIPTVIYLLNANILGSDNDSLQTEYSYINTVTKSIDGIKSM